MTTMLKPISELLKALVAGALFAGLVVLVAQAVGLDFSEAWRLPLAVIAMVFGSLFAPEYFYGEPHPFRRRTDTR